MEIYVENAVFDNLLMNFIILFLSHRLLKKNIVKTRLVMSVLLGTIVSVMMPLFYIPTWLAIFVKFSLAISMVLISFKSKTFKEFAIQCFTFVSTTGVLGGVSFGVIYAFGGEISFLSGQPQTNEFPLGVLYLIILAYVLLFVSAVKYFYRKRKSMQFIFPIKIIVNNIEVRTDAFLDSGNVLTDPVSQKPVIIIGYKTFSKMFEKLPLEKVLLKKITEKEIKQSHYISYSTISGEENNMLIFPIDNLIVNFGVEKKEVKNVVGGLSFAKFQKSFNCDVLLHHEYF